MKPIQPTIEKVCHEMLVKTFLREDGDLYLPRITGTQWQYLITNCTTDFVSLLESAFNEARLLYEAKQRKAKEEQELLKEYYAWREAECKKIIEECDEEIERLHKEDQDCAPDAWYNQGE